MASEKSAVRHRRRRRRTRRFLWIPVVLIPLLALGGAWLWFHQHYVVAGGEVYPRTISTLDLRGERISPERYESLRETLPDCRILWDVPLGGERYDCTSGAVTLSGFSAGDEKNLSYFSDLQAVDAVDAPLTPAQYEAIRAALPEAYIRWCVPIGGGRYPSDAREIVLTGLSAEDIPLFAYFTDLRTIDARSCGDYDALMALRSRLPEADLLWKVPFLYVATAWDL